jgi:DNA polymerase I
MVSVEVRDPYISREVFENYLAHLQNFPIISVDTEGSLSHPHSQTWGLSTSASGKGDYFGFNHMLGSNLPSEWLPELVTVLQDKTLVMHHAKHDLRALKNLSLNFSGRFYCTMLMGHMVNENRFNQGLDSLSKAYGGEPKRNDELMNNIIKAFGWEYVPVEVIREYGFNDAFITEELFYNLWPEFEGQGFDGELWDYEQKFCRLLVDMEDTGILIDQEHCELELRRGLAIMKEIQSFLGFYPSSPIELGKFFLEELHLPVVKVSQKTGKPSFDKKVLEVYDEILQQSQDKRAQAVLTYRGWQKTTSSNYRSYLEKVSLVDGRLRPNFKQHGTKTGRTSCTDPNLQQIPRSSPKDWNGQLKRAFISPPGYSGWEFDYSQLEMRLLAAYTKSQNLLAIFRDDSRDLFNEMAAELGMQRDPTKTLNYAIGYGAGKTRVSNIFNVSELAAQAIISRYYSRYPGIKKFADHAQRRADENGFIKYWTGRRRHFMFPSENHKAGNSAIQGGAFEIVKRQSIRLQEEGLISKECQLNLTVHDSLRFDIEDGKESIYIPEIKRVLEDVRPEFGVPFRVDCHKWGTKEKWVA